MIVFLLFIVVLLIGLTAAAVMGRISGFLADPASSQSFDGVPTGPLSTDDVATLHFDQALRGYRMNQVDEVIDAMRARLGELEEQVASLPSFGRESPAVGGPLAFSGDSLVVSGDRPSGDRPSGDRPSGDPPSGDPPSGDPLHQ